MTTNIPSSRPSQTTPPPLSPIPSPRTPTGISSQPTTLILAHSATKPNSCFRCFQSIGNFFRSGCLFILKSIGGFINFLKAFLENEPDPVEAHPNAWMLPQEQPQLPVTTPPPAVNRPPSPVVNSPSPPVENSPPSSVVNSPSQPVVNSPPPPVADPFSSLPITSDEMRKIFQIVHRLGTTSPIFLLPHRATLEQLGREIEHVHPLRFLEYILLHNTLRTDLDAIRSNSWIWPQFLQGLSRKLERERGPLASMLPGFARSLQIDPAQIEPFLNAGQWERMAFFLLDVKLGRISLPPIVAPQPPPPIPPTPIPAVENPSPSNSEPPPEPAPSVDPLPPASPAAESPSPSNSEPPPEPVPSVESLPPSPPQQTPWQQIALTDEQKNMVADVVRTHRNMSYTTVSWGDRHAASLWDRLDRAHPLALVAHIFTTPEIMADLNALWLYRLHRRYFILELSALLNQKPEGEYLPYIADFSNAVEQMEQTMIAHIHFRKWRELIELLKFDSATF